MDWANQRVVDLLRETEGEPPKALRVLAHLVGAERVWLARIQRSDAAGLEIWPELDVERVATLSRETAAGFANLLGRSSPGELAQPVQYRNSRGVEYSTPMADILTHVALHGSYHRGQIAREVRHGGAEPVNTDYITYVRSVDLA